MCLKARTRVSGRFMAVLVILWLVFTISGFAAPVASGANLPIVPPIKGTDGILSTEPAESAALKGATIAGQRISENIDFFERTVSGLFGDWVRTNTILSVTYLRLITCFVLLIVVLVVNRIIRYFIDQKIRSLLAGRQRFTEIVTFWDALSTPLSLFILVYGTFLAFTPVLMELKDVKGLSLAYVVAGKAADFAGYISIIWFVYRLVNVMEASLRRKITKTQSHLDDTIVPLLGRTVRVFVIIIGTAIIVKNITGLDFGPLLASLGIGGIAVAFAAKDSIGNFLGSLTILFDRPFTVGDRIVIDGNDGTVEEVGFRSTRIRTLTGSQVTIPNEKVINTMVENIGRRPYTRWLTNLAIPAGTPPDKAERAVNIIRDILQDHEGMNPDCPPRVYISGFNEKNINITIIAWYHSSNAWDYEEWVQRICLDILRSLEREGIVLAGGGVRA
ncbi:MAG TPA: mechanosensitive ion channel family protein [Deltaproteobacteria bacterium]|nr:mechanosensitive ion channel family protein [Deltaproteobacteria bacterium]